MANKFEVATIFKAVDRMSAPISKMQNKIGIFARSAERNMRRVGRATDKVMRGVKSMGKSLLVGGALLTGGLVQATAAGINFEQMIVNAAAKYPGEITRGTEAFAQLEAAAMQTGKTTEFSATQAAEALNFLAMAGFNAEQSIASMPGVVDLATAAQVDLGTATDIATDSLGALNLMSKDSEQLTRNLARVNDVLAKTTTSANVTMVEMFESIKDGAPVAIAAGQSFETIATLIGAMGNAGIKGTRGGTALKNIMIAMSAPGSEAAEIMRRLGVQTVDTNGNVRDAVLVFKDFIKATDGLPSAQKLGVFEKIFGKIGLAGALNLTNAADTLEGFRDTLISSEGASSKMADTMRDTTRGSLNSLKSAVEGVAISLFALNRGPMKEAIDKTTEWVRANGDAIASGIGNFFLDLAENIGTYVAAAKKIAIAVGILWTLNTVLKAIQVTMALVGIAMTANPIGLAIAGIAAAATALYIAWEPLKQLFLDTWDALQKITTSDVAGFLGLNSEADRTTPHAYATGGIPAVSSPQQRGASIYNETRSSTTNTTEVIVRAEQGTTAETAPGKETAGVKVMNTGGF